MIYINFLSENDFENMYAYIIGEGRSILMAFSDNCINSPLILYQNTTSGSFLKGSCDTQSESISKAFHVLLHENPLICLACWMAILPMSGLTNHALAIWNYAYLPKLHVLLYNILKNHICWCYHPSHKNFWKYRWAVKLSWCFPSFYCFIYKLEFYNLF